MELIIISGRSGSGKSTVLHVLEDRGYYCIDNLPASLLPSLADRISQDSEKSPKVAVSIDARNLSSDLQQVPNIIENLRGRDLSTEVVFLDANSQTLLKRFNESRRKHPLSSQQIGLIEAVDMESTLLAPISMLASLNIDTSNMTLQALRKTIKSQVVGGEAPGMALLFESFGFKNGVPVEADIVYDVRCLPNPYWNTNLRALTGLDSAVANYLDNESEVSEMIDDIQNYLEKWLPSYESNNRSYMTIAIGCTGGQHRSVFICERLGALFSNKIPNVQIRHRELSQ